MYYRITRICLNVVRIAIITALPNREQFRCNINQLQYDLLDTVTANLFSYDGVWHFIGFILQYNYREFVVHAEVIVTQFQECVIYCNVYNFSPAVAVIKITTVGSYRRADEVTIVSSVSCGRTI